MYLPRLLIRITIKCLFLNKSLNKFYFVEVYCLLLNFYVKYSFFFKSHRFDIDKNVFIVVIR